LLQAEYFAKKIASLRLSRAIFVLLSVSAFCLSAPQPAGAQGAPAPSRPDSYWRLFALGFAGSILAHETAHVLTAYAVGSHPYFAFDHGRPTIFSGIDSRLHPHKQFLFSAAGLTTQALLDETILDIPHSRGSAIERGILAGGIGTTVFYITIGRNGSVSDIAFMARTSSLSKTQLSLIFGGFSAIHAWRISRDPRYAHFFMRLAENGAAVGFTF
jgi:membrane-associated protease RseP (regulator of RpoE activity)